MRDGGWTDAIALLPRGRRMWVLFNEGKLVRYDLDTRRAQQVASGLGWAKFALIDPQGRLWVGTHGTLWRIDDLAAAQPTAQAIRTGLPTDTSYLGATADPHGRLWFATSHGLLRYARGRFGSVDLRGPIRAGGLVDVAAGAATRYGWPRSPAACCMHGRGTVTCWRSSRWTTRCSMPRRSIRWSWIGKAGYGRCMVAAWTCSPTVAGGGSIAPTAWCGTTCPPAPFSPMRTARSGSAAAAACRTCCTPNALPRPRMTAPVLLDVRYGSAPVRPGTAPSLKWSGQSLTVTLARIGVAHPATQQLAYRLRKNHGTATQETTHGSSVHFAALEPGRYRFEARFVDPDLRAESPWTGFDVVVAPPWWRSAPAKFGYGLLGLALIAVLWRWRNARLLRRQAELEAMVRERTLALENDKRALEAAREALQYEASHDALTGLLNRGAVVEALVAAVAQAGETQRRVAVALIDLDHFKRINDTYGHLTGDAVLVQCAERLAAMTPADAALGRYGGEELLVVWPGLPGDADLDSLFQPLMDTPYLDGATQVRVTCSVGLTWARHGEDATDLLRRADTALYRAKEAGRARVVRAD